MGRVTERLQTPCPSRSSSNRALPQELALGAATPCFSLRNATFRDETCAVHGA
jgi:hypothetical protein